MGLVFKCIDYLLFDECKVYYCKVGKCFLLLCLLGILYNYGWGIGMLMVMDEICYVSVFGCIVIVWFFCVMLVWYISLWI